MRSLFRTSALLAVLGVATVVPTWVHAQSAEQAAEEVTFGTRAFTAGETIEFNDRHAFDLAFNILVEGEVLQSQAQERKERARRTHTILAVDDEGMPTSQRIAVHEKVTEESQSGGFGEMSNETVSPTSGRVYIATCDDEGNWSFAYCESDTQAEEGDEVSDEECEELAKHAEGEIVVNLRETLGGNSFAEGDVVDLTADQLFGEPDGELEVRHFSMVFAGTREVADRRVAVFAIELTFGIDPNEAISITMEMKGELLVEIETSLPLGMSLSGPVQLKGGADGMVFEGSGTMTMNGRIAITRPERSGE